MVVNPILLWALCISLSTSGAVLTTPLFPEYALLWNINSLTTTEVYAAYIIGTLLALICCGNLSDKYGRKPMIIIGLISAMFGVLLLLLAPDVYFLFPARIFQGLAVGLIASSASAALAEYSGNSSKAALIATISNVFGMASGILLTGLIAEYLPLPLRTSYAIYLCISLPILVLTFRLPETRKAVFSSLTAENSRPDTSPSTYVLAVATTLIGFSSFAVILSIGPKLAMNWAYSNNLMTGAIFTSLACCCAGIAQVSARKTQPTLGVYVSIVTLSIGIAILLSAGYLINILLLYLSAIIIGLGYGLIFYSSLTLVQKNIPNNNRGTWLSGYFIAAYLGMSIPAIGLGFLIDQYGLLKAIEIFAIYIWIISLILILGFTIHIRTLNRRTIATNIPL